MSDRRWGLRLWLTSLEHLIYLSFKSWKFHFGPGNGNNHGGCSIIENQDLNVQVYLSVRQRKSITLSVSLPNAVSYFVIEIHRCAAKRLRCGVAVCM